MRWSPWIVGALAAIGALTVGVHAQEHGAGEGGSPEVDVTDGETAMVCTSSVNTLVKEIEVLFSDYNTIINCFAFGTERSLEHGVVSVFQLDGTPVARYNLTCRGNEISTTQLVGQNASHVENTACLECASTRDDEICHWRKSVDYH